MATVSIQSQVDTAWLRVGERGQKKSEEISITDNVNWVYQCLMLTLLHMTVRLSQLDGSMLPSDRVPTR